MAALVVPALLLNGLTLVIAWLSRPGANELLAEVRVLRELCEVFEHERVCLVRVERLVKGESESSLLKVRFPPGVLPEGIALADRRHLADRLPLPGERLFVVLRKEQECGYSVEHYWPVAPRRARTGSSGEPLAATV